MNYRELFQQILNYAEFDRMPEGDQKNQLLERIEQVKNGDRDLYF